MVRICGFEGGMVVKVHNPNTPEAEARGGPDSDKYVLHSKMLSENKGEKENKYTQSYYVRVRGCFQLILEKSNKLYCILFRFQNS